LERKTYTDAEVREATRLYKRAVKADQYTGKRTHRDALPESVREAYRQGSREYERSRLKQLRERKPPRKPPRKPLREDGIIDDIAVWICASGQRVVDLTTRERLLAVQVMLANGLGQTEISRRLDVHPSTAYTLGRRVRSQAA
jgi:DNA-binding NarL/FixJ family response regulator